METKFPIREQKQRRIIPPLLLPTGCFWKTGSAHAQSPSALPQLQGHNRIFPVRSDTVLPETARTQPETVSGLFFNSLFSVCGIISPNRISSPLIPASVSATIVLSSNIFLSLPLLSAGNPSTPACSPSQTSRLFSKNCRGLFLTGGTCQIISAGTGEHTIPVRIWNRRELIITDIGKP